jgi:hypothetical protein
MSARSNDSYNRRKRQKNADRRAAERAERTDAEQLDLLIVRGHGECDEAYRLRRRIRNANG